MTRQRALLAVPVLLAVGLVWLVLRDGGSEPRAVESPAPQARVVAPRESALDASTREVQTTELATPASEGDRVVSALPEIEVETPEPELAHLVGRFLLPDGGPAVGVTLGVRGWGANTERKQKYGEPEDWVDPEGTTDDEGRFDIAFDPPRAYQFVLGAKLAGYAELSWRWHALPPREVTDVGEQTFVATGTIVGRVVGADGSPTETRWYVYADSTYGPTGEGADKTRVRGPAELDTGAFRLEDVPPGSVQLKASSSSGTLIRGPVVQVRVGEETRVDLVYEGPDDSRRIVVRTSCRPFSSFGSLEHGLVTCTADDGRMLFPSETSRPTRSHSFEDLEPGSYTIEIDSPRFQPWSQSGVRPGERVNARLEGNAAITLVVRDGETGEEVVAYGLRLRFEGASFSGNTIQVREYGGERPLGGLYEGLIPFDTTLIVRAEGFAPLEIPVGELAPGTTVHVEGELVLGGTLHGVVTTAGGIPVERAAVLLHPHLEGYDPDNTLTWPRGMSEQSAFRSRSLDAETDTRGRFLLQGIAPGDYDVRATAGGVSASEEHVAVSSGATAQVALRLPGTGAIVGRVKGPPQADFAGLQLLVLPAGVDRRHMPTMMLRSGDKLPQAGVGEEGTFRLSPVREGRATVFLTMAPQDQPTGFSGSITSSGSLLELGEVEVQAGADTRFDIDLTANFPGAIVLDVRVNGEPIPGAVVTAVKGEQGGAEEARAVGQLDASSRVRLFPVFIGDWQVHVRPLEGGWSYEHPALIPIGSAGEVELEIDIIVAGGRVLILDAIDGTPLAKRHVRVGGGRTYVTDAGGWLDMQLTPGTYELRDGGDGEGRVRGVQATALEWTSDGPAQEEVRLTRAGEDGR